MNASTLAGSARPTLRIRGTEYPILLPKVSDPRLHLAFVIITLQVLGQAAFGFQLSIAQILVSLATCAVIEFAITFHQQRVIMWPASALLTGNGVAFILRVPGTPHGDWWSLNGWWVFAATAAVSILSKHVIRIRGHHVFNPSNFGLVLCFVLLGAAHADPLAFWWGPMSPWMMLALAVILVGAFAILSRLHLLAIAVTFWITFAIGIGVIAAAGHEMTARWHLGPITGFEFWRVVVLSPEVMVFLFFMITDPKTTPLGRVGRRVYAVSVALLAVLLIAPQTTEFWTKVSLLGALWIVCAARPVVAALAPRMRPSFAQPRRRTLGVVALAGVAAFAGVLVLAGIPARPEAAVASAATENVGALPQITVLPSKGVATQIDEKLARQMTADLVSDLRIEADALARRDKARAAEAAGGKRLQGLWQQISSAGTSAIIVPQRHVDRVQLQLEPAVGQDPPIVVATTTGTERLVTFSGTPAAVAFRGNTTPFTRTLELQLDGGRYLIVGSRGGTPEAVAPGSSAQLVSSGLGGARLQNVAAGGGDRLPAERHPLPDERPERDDGRRRLLDRHRQRRLARPLRRQLLRGRRPPPTGSSTAGRRGAGSSTTSGAVSRTSAARRGRACRSGATAASPGTSTATATPICTSPPTGYDALLWNDGTGHFSEGARAAGITTWGWHSGATIGDVNGDGRPDIFVSGYADMNLRVATDTGFPNNYAGVRDLLYLNEGNDEHGSRTGSRRSERSCTWIRARPSTGSALYSATSTATAASISTSRTTPTRTGSTSTSPSPVVPRRTRSASASASRSAPPSVGVADPSAGMGIAAADYSGDGRPDLSSRTRTSSSMPCSRAAPPDGRQARLQGRPFGHRVGLRHEPRRLGRLLGRPRQRLEPRSRARERRHPGGGTYEERGADAGLREPDGARPSRGSSSRRRTPSD